MSVLITILKVFGWTLVVALSLAGLCTPWKSLICLFRLDHRVSLNFALLTLSFATGVGDLHRTMLETAIPDPMFTPPPYQAPKFATDIRQPKWSGTPASLRTLHMTMS